MSFRAFKTSVLVIKETCQLILMMNDAQLEIFGDLKNFIKLKYFITEKLSLLNQRTLEKSLFWVHTYSSYCYSSVITFITLHYIDYTMALATPTSWIWSRGCKMLWIKCVQVYTYIVYIVGIYCTVYRHSSAHAKKHFSSVFFLCKTNIWSIWCLI